MDNSKLKDLVIKILILIIIVLIVSNAYTYTKYKELKGNLDYTRNFSSAISIAALDNDYGFLTSNIHPNNSEDLMEKFEQVKPKIDRSYGLKNYVVINYKNNNSLLIKTSENEQGKVLIDDMFLLDETIFEKLKED